MVHHAHATLGHETCDWGHSDRPSPPLVAWNGDQSLLRDIDSPKGDRAVESICIASAPSAVPSRWCITHTPPLDMWHAIGATQTGRHHRSERRLVPTSLKTHMAEKHHPMPAKAPLRAS